MAYTPTLDDVLVSTLRLSLGDVGTVGLTSPPFDVMNDPSRCPSNCSGHGVWEDGQCLCLVQYSGGTCQERNIGYYIAFGSIFLLLGCVALVQLVLCVLYEYAKEDKKSWRKACQVTVQKLLYLLVIFATAIRGAYFFSRWQVSEEVASSLWSAYFPVIITGFSLIVCFWAEAFHISWSPSGERQFLSKSTMFFITFNVLQYLLWAAQLVVAEVVDDHENKMLVLRVCNGGFALLMIIVVVFFLIYGVEVYFKVRGAFRVSESGLDSWQLHMSRLGLVAQAALQLITALFLASDVAFTVWKHKLPVLSQNFYDIGFRIVEFGVALWFPCVLWNCGRPEELWVLNPKRIFRSFDFQRQRKQTEREEADRGEGHPIRAASRGSHYDTFDTVSQNSRADCWICYDAERKDAGALIQPCACKGDVATVHHDCLKKWLVESAASQASPECRVCGEKYHLEAHYWMPQGLRPRHWLQTFLGLMMLTGLPFAAYAVCHSMSSASRYLQILVIGAAVLMEIFFFRMFVQNIGSSCQRARVATMRISGTEVIPATRPTTTTTTTTTITPPPPPRPHRPDVTQVKVTVHQGQGSTLEAGRDQEEGGDAEAGRGLGAGSVQVHVTAESSLMRCPVAAGHLHNSHVP